MDKSNKVLTKQKFGCEMASLRYPRPFQLAWPPQEVVISRDQT